MKQVYTERMGAENAYPYRVLEVKAFETDSSDPELLPALIHVHFFDYDRIRDRKMSSPLEVWYAHDGLRGAQIIRKAIMVFDEAVVIYFATEEGAESH